MLKDYNAVEHRQFLIKIIEGFREGRITWPKVFTIAEKKYGIKPPHRNTVGKDPELSAAYEQRKKLLQKMDVRPSQTLDEKVLMRRLDEQTMLNLILTRMLINRGVAEDEITKAYRAAEEGRPWA